MSTIEERTRPAKDEYHEFYETYVSKVPDADVVGFLRAQTKEALELFRSVPDDRVDYRYETGKWSVKEVLGHCLDAEWVFTALALRFARGDESPLPGIDQDDYVNGANFADRDYAGMVDELEHLRGANLLLFGSFDEAVLSRRGTASNCAFTVRSKLFIIAGHLQHHLQVLRERYLAS